VPFHLPDENGFPSSDEAEELFEIEEKSAQRWQVEMSPCSRRSSQRAG
jgi:hypothetical protein